MINKTFYALIVLVVLEFLLLLYLTFEDPYKNIKEDARIHYEIRQEIEKVKYDDEYVLFIEKHTLDNLKHNDNNYTFYKVLVVYDNWYYEEYFVVYHEKDIKVMIIESGEMQ